MHRNECFHRDAHSFIVSPRSMQELMASPQSRYAHCVLYIGHRSPATSWALLISINSVLLRITSPIPVIFNIKPRLWRDPGPHNWVENSKRWYYAWCTKADEFKRKLLAQQEEAGIQVVKAISNVLRPNQSWSGCDYCGVSLCKSSNC